MVFLLKGLLEKTGKLMNPFLGLGDEADTRPGNANLAERVQALPRSKIREFRNPMYVRFPEVSTPHSRAPATRVAYGLEDTVDNYTDHPEVELDLSDIEIVGLDDILETAEVFPDNIVQGPAQFYDNGHQIPLGIFGEANLHEYMKQNAPVTVADVFNYITSNAPYK